MFILFMHTCHGTHVGGGGDGELRDYMKIRVLSYTFPWVPGIKCRHLLGRLLPPSPSPSPPPLPLPLSLFSSLSVVLGMEPRTFSMLVKA